MFAVQGWNVSSTGLKQEQAKKPSSAPRSTDAGSESHKRKRSDRDAALSRKIEGSELEKLWNERFGEEKTGKASTKGQKKQRDGRDTTDSASPHQNGDKALSKLKIQSEQKPSRDVAGLTKKDETGRTGPTPARKAKRDNAQQDTRDSPNKLSKAGKEKQEGSQKGRRAPAHDAAAAAAESIATMLPPPPPVASNLTPLQAKMRLKLTSARFRHLNETLYTNPSATALSLFAATPSLFAEYHDGFSQQVSSSWPRNPVDDFISSIKARGPLSNSNNPLPRRKTQSCTVADLGCGDAPLARALIPSFTKKLKLTIHSYDLHAPNQHVTVADIAKLPLRDGEADLAVFCLSLMGTNWIDFVEEAWRVLRGDGKGEIWVAEVKSRFGRGGERGSRRGEAVNHSVGKQRKQPRAKESGKKKKAGDEDEGDEADLPVDLFTSESANQPAEDTPDLRPFIDVWTRRGFQLKPNSVDAANKMFVSMIFFKSGIPTAGKHKGMKWNGKEYERIGKSSDDDADKIAEGKVLKPCVYKTR